MKNYIPTSCKIYILYSFKKGPWGGGNQFLKALKYQFDKIGVYQHNPIFADVIIFNSHHKLTLVKFLKRLFPKKIFVHRLDGPLFKTRGQNLEIDQEIFKINQQIADASVFMSHWTREESYRLGLIKKKHEIVIINAPDSSIFNNINKHPFNKYKKIKLITTSWSPNPRKGFEIYQYLDNNLDFSKYEMTFIGNSPINFKNINYLPPLKSEELAQKLKDNDIFIAASQNDPCSNSLIEAIHCSLPSIALNSGGHPEIIQINNGGLLFENGQDLIEKIEKIVNNYSAYQNKITPISINQIANQYCQFIKTIC